jgi:hypothetical protein
MTITCEIRIITLPNPALCLLLSAVYLPQSTFALSERKMLATLSKNMTSFYNSWIQLRATWPLICYADVARWRPRMKFELIQSPVAFGS